MNTMSTMNTLCRSLLVSSALALLLTACQKTPEPPKTATPTAPAVPASQAPAKDPSLPTASADATPPCTAEQTAGAQKNASPGGKMTKDEERCGMPLPGQATHGAVLPPEKGK